MKPAYKFVKNTDPKNPFSTVKVIHTTQLHDMNLDGLAEMFQDFLLACGFSPRTRVVVEVDEEVSRKETE